MPDVFLRCTAPIKPPIPADPSAGPFVFRLAAAGARPAMTATISASGGSVTTEQAAQVSEALFACLRNDVAVHDYPKAVGSEFSDRIGELYQACGDVAELLAEEFKHAEFLHVGAASRYWSTDGTTWETIRGGFWQVSFAGGSAMTPLNQDTAAVIQARFDSGDQPWVATSYLHEAERATSVRLRWIQATIAAEIAIKEALIRMEPKLEQLIVEMPSPPIHKLYGAILKEFTGSPSPYVGKLQKGVERRNRLVHRPARERLDLRESFEYVRMVRDAITDLRARCTAMSARRPEPGEQ